MAALSGGYESFFGLGERPFSLTPDPHYYFRSRSHARAFDSLAFSLRRRERFVLVTGDAGLGKSTLCRAVSEQMGHRLRTSLLPNPLLSPEDVLRLMLEDFGASLPHAAQENDLPPSRFALRKQLYEHLYGMGAAQHGPALVVDDAHRLPSPVVAELLSLAGQEREGKALISVVLVAHAVEVGRGTLAVRLLDQKVSSRVRLLALEREECSAYVTHRLHTAGAAAHVTFSARALDLVYRLSGGVPRLINLLCDGALHECALVRAHRVEVPMIETSAADLEITRARPRRFRWFGRRVS